MEIAWWIALIAMLISIVVANGDDNDNSLATFVIMFVLIGILIGISICLAITTI